MRLLVALVFAGLFCWPALAGDRLYEGGRHTITGGIITKPVGLYSRYDLAFSTDILESAFGEGPWGEIAMGVYTQYFFYSNELGVQLSWETDPALIRFTLDLAFEPGAFIHTPELTARTFDTRKVIRAINYINLKLDSFWLYSRSTALVRLRDFEEYDPFNDIVLRDEIGFEQATALFLPIMDLPASRRREGLRPRLWVYGEYTIGVVLDIDARPNRVSAGLVTENWPLPYLGMNLDLFYSFANEPITGPGGIFVWGFAW